ncbi:disease resistance protein RPP8 [Ziziphus jujuba]|uniref:Disease resistance protein RPP8 n=1 Tax=Ziziphus jujuba TaxID=326968 RepID=A0A6P4A9D2_ZIZJJ|nr:disease resistance protein RPP8 [Ziziphus jujuba]
MSFPGERFVIYAVDKLIKEVAKRKKLVDGVEGELGLLQADLEIINAFLQDEGEQREHGRATKLVIMKQMRDVIFDAEKVVDEYIYHAVMKKGKKPGPYKRLGISKTIVAIKKRIEGIEQNRGRYVPESGAQPQNAAEADDVEKKGIHYQKNEAVGLDRIKIEMWVEELKDTNLQRYSLITGMGGLGKSKLAWNIYGSIADGEHFNYRLWVCGSRNFKARDWLLKILEGLQSKTGETATDDNQGKNDEELGEAIRKHLKDKRYLLVLDGMWDTGEWEILESMLRGLDDGSNIMGSKILITCREEVITSNAQRQYWSLEPLEKLPSWDLLRNKVFPAKEEPNDELIKAGKKLAADCKGLPLSIVVLGELLLQARERGVHSARTWESYRRHVNFELIRRQTRCFHVLAESYQHLLPRLKFCFLYLGLFSSSAEEEEEEGFKISAAHIKELWSAEGFIQDDDNDSRDVLDIGQDCLTKLVNGSLVQVVSKRIVGDTVKTFCIHSILRELSRYEGEREKFTEFLFDNRNASSKGRGQRLSIQGDVFKHIFLSEYDSSSARSLFLFNQSTVTNFDDSKFWRKIGQSFRYVRVLYLWKVPIQTIPKEIENLIFLKSITIWGDKKLKIKSVSDFICKLVHVESINIDGHVSKYLPEILEDE